MSSRNKFLYSKKTKSYQFPFHIVVKQHDRRKVLYITYGGGRKNGGGAWSENLDNVHPRTLNMIKDYLGQHVVDDLMDLDQKPTKTKHENKSSDRA
tara:strand:+ start:2483 stop:2770 length:288 start_codon:yes stop_codon:yes gene_type:complete